MIHRRDLVMGGLVAGVLASPRVGFAKAVTEASSVGFEVPAGACDCHTHIHGDPAQYPWFAGRTYTPEPAYPDEMLKLHRALGIQRVVIVTPSVYGTDNSATLWGMEARGGDARGVAVIDDKTPDSEMEKMRQAGMRGVRLNLATTGVRDPVVARRMVEEMSNRLTKWDWHLQVNTSLPVLTAMKDVLANAPVPIVIDHFGGASPDQGVDQPGFSDLADLVKSGKAYVKISVKGGGHASYEGFAPLARALIAANPDRILWGTNWPHPDAASGKPAMEVSPLWQVDDGLVLRQLAVWAPEADMRRRILVDNPAEIYKF